MFVENHQFEPTPPLLDAVGISPRFLASKNYNTWAIVCHCVSTFSRFDTVPACDTDRRTDRRRHDNSIYLYYRASIASRGKNEYLTSFIVLADNLTDYCYR